MEGEGAILKNQDGDVGVVGETAVHRLRLDSLPGKDSKCYISYLSNLIRLLIEECHSVSSSYLSLHWDSPPPLQARGGGWVSEPHPEQVFSSIVGRKPHQSSPAPPASSDRIYRLPSQHSGVAAALLSVHRNVSAVLICVCELKAH
ncbi:hypothetical protein MHYP_G00298590 [Metynnis hypsauchen]